MVTIPHSLPFPSAELTLEDEDTSAAFRMAWGKNRRGASASASAPRSSSGGRGGRRRPPGEPSEQDIARNIQRSALRVRVALQLGTVDGNETLQSVIAQFGDKFDARRTQTLTPRRDVRVELLECGLNSWQNLVEMQRVLGGLKRPTEQLMARTTLRHDAKYDEWSFALSVNRHSEDALWKFASSLMLRLKSCGVWAKVLLPSHRLKLPLMSAFVEWGNSEMGEYQWEGTQAWSEVVVSVVDGEKQEIQRVLLAPTQDGTDNLRYPGLMPVVNDMLSGNADGRKPIVVILRGIPGSGKSTLGRGIDAICHHRGVAFTACSADYFFETSRGYVFDVKKLGAAHSKCKADFTRAVQGDIPRNQGERRPHQHVILIDNTSTQKWEYEPYEDIAKSNGCRVRIIEMKCPDVLTAFRMGQRNSHGVPPEKVVSMFMRWEDDPLAHSFTPQFEYPTLTANPLSDGGVGGLTFLGLFLDADSQQRLLAEVPTVHPNRVVDHVTLFYRPNKQYVRDAELGASFTIHGVEVVNDDRGQSLRVELDEKLHLQMRNKIPHITMSTEDGVSASYSNDLLESAAATRTTIDPPIALTARVGAALLVQNQRVITTSSPFAVDSYLGSMDNMVATVADNSLANNGEVLSEPITSQLYILYINESDLMNNTEEDLARLVRRAQVLHSMDSQHQARRLLCIQRSQDCTSTPSTLLLRRLQDRFLISTPRHFDDLMVISRPHSLFSEFEEGISRYLTDARFGPISKLTMQTMLKESMQWPLREMNPFQDTMASVFYVGLSDNASRYDAALASPTPTIFSVLDFLGINIEERTRNAILAGMNAVEQAWAQVLGTSVNADLSTLQRFDSTLLGLSSSTVELCLTLPSEATQSEMISFKVKLLCALRDTHNVRHVVASEAPDLIYFTLCIAPGYAPVFCVQMVTRSKGSDSDVGADDVAQLRFCEHLQQTSDKLCDIEAYSVLTVLLRAILLGQCSAFLPSKSRLSSLVNLTSERLVLQYFQSTELGGEVDARPTVDDVTSGRIIFALYRMLYYLSKLSLEEWRAAFGDSLLALQGTARAQSAWVQAMTSAMESCKSVMASYCCVGEGLKQPASLNPQHHLGVIATLMKARVDTASGATCAYIDVSTRCKWSQLHSQVLCDKLRHAATMVMPQADNERYADEFFFCAPSLAARRVDVTASTLEVLRIVLEEVNARVAVDRDFEVALAGDYVIRRAESDEEVLTDLKRGMISSPIGGT